MSATPVFPPSLEAAYRPVRVLGAGGMGAVWLAQDRALDRPVAIKLMIRPDVPTLAKRMEREAAVLGRLKHPHVAQVFAAGSVPEGPYIVFEYVEGRSLAAETLPEPRALDLMLQAASGLEAVHGAGVVHRDLTPKNIMRTPAERALLIDFGLVFDPDRTRLTATGMAVGTPGAIPPEAWRGAVLGPAADWFGWGASLYGILQGRYPYDLAAVGLMAETGIPIPLAPTKPMSPGVTRIIEACLHPDPDRRPASRAALEDLLGEGPGRVSGARGRVVVSSGATAAPPAPLPVPGPAPTEGRRAGWGAALAAGLCALGLALWSGRGAAPAPEPGPATTDPAVPGSDWIKAALEELEAARGATVRDPADGSERPVLDPDPLAYGRVVGAQATVGRIRGWLGNGGRIEELDPDTRTGLEAVDRAWAERGLGRPFQAFRTVERAPGPRGWAPAFKVRFGLADPAPAGWLPAVGEAYDALAGELAKLDREPPPELVAVPVALLGAAKPGPVPATRWLEETAARREGRLAVRERVRAGHEALERLIHAAARAVAEEPERRAMAAALAAIVCFDLRAFFHGPLMGGFIEGLTGPETSTPEGALLRARVLDRILYARRGTGREAPDLAREEAELWLQAHDGLGREGFARMAGDVARAGLVDSLVEQDRGAELAAFLDRLRDGDDRPDPWVETEVLIDVANWIETRRGPGGLDPGRVAWVAGRLETLGPGLPPGEVADRARRRALALRGRAGR